MAAPATLDIDAVDLRLLHDERSIHALVASFADAATSRLERLADLWVPEATFTNPADGVRFQGADEVTAGLTRLRGQWTSFVHDEHSIALDITGDRATGRTRCHQVTRSPSTGAFMTFAAFDDVYARHEGRWRFASRTYAVLEQLRAPLPAVSPTPTAVSPAQTRRGAAAPAHVASTVSPFCWQQAASSP